MVTLRGFRRVHTRCHRIVCKGVAVIAGLYLIQSALGSVRGRSSPARTARTPGLPSTTCVLRYARRA